MNVSRELFFDVASSSMMSQLQESLTPIGNGDEEIEIKVKICMYRI
jgi:hypothetical protein